MRLERFSPLVNCTAFAHIVRLSIEMALPGWNSLEDVRRIASDVEIGTLVFWSPPRESFGNNSPRLRKDASESSASSPEARRHEEVRRCSGSRAHHFCIAAQPSELGERQHVPQGARGCEGFFCGRSGFRFLSDRRANGYRSNLRSSGRNPVQPGLASGFSPKAHVK
jgi:hypothetical protein